MPGGRINPPQGSFHQPIPHGNSNGLIEHLQRFVGKIVEDIKVGGIENGWGYYIDR